MSRRDFYSSACKDVAKLYKDRHGIRPQVEFYKEDPIRGPLYKVSEGGIPRGIAWFNAAGRVILKLTEITT